MKIPVRINDDIIISNNDKDNDVSNGLDDKQEPRVTTAPL